MNKRKFLKQTALVSAGASIAPLLLLSACKSEAKKEENMKTAKVATTIFELPELPYGYNAFPETIDPMTMEIPLVSLTKVRSKCKPITFCA